LFHIPQTQKIHPNPSTTFGVILFIDRRRFRTESYVAEAYPPSGALCWGGLNHTKLLYDQDQPDGQLILAFNQLGKHTRSQGLLLNRTCHFLLQWWL